MLFHNIVLEHLATESADGVAASLACYRDSPPEIKALPLVGRLAEALYAVQADIQRMRASFQHEKGRGMDVSRFGYTLAVEDYEKPAPTPSEDAARMDYVLRQAKRDPHAQPQPSPKGQQSQTPRQGGGGGGFWQARRQQKKAEKAKAGSGKAPFYGYTGAKNGKKKT